MLLNYKAPLTTTNANSNPYGFFARHKDSDPGVKKTRKSSVNMEELQPRTLAESKSKSTIGAASKIEDAIKELETTLWNSQTT